MYDTKVVQADLFVKIRAFQEEEHFTVYQMKNLHIAIHEQASLKYMSADMEINLSFFIKEIRLTYLT